MTETVEEIEEKEEGLRSNGRIQTQWTEREREGEGEGEGEGRAKGTR
ncbi:MAG: hypothetical protein MJE68_16230 [Proteobacteria bacterium]|nr:hypothetical protein [Pseudomonadota bacterium]